MAIHLQPNEKKANCFLFFIGAKPRQNHIT